MINITPSSASCGVREITGVRTFGHGFSAKDFKEKIIKYARDEIKRRAAFGDGGGAISKDATIGFFFSDRVDAGDSDEQGGRGLASYIEESNIGVVSECRSFQNYNTGHRIKFWFFYLRLSFLDEALKRPEIRKPLGWRRKNV